MSLARVGCRAQIGLEAPAVDVEVHVGAGLPSFNVVGLLATEVKESRERVRAALINTGFELPAGRITVNLAPADLPKDGGRFDLAIAIGILLASGQLQPKMALADVELLGELGLAGELRAVRGVLPAAAAAASAGRMLLVPWANAREFHDLPQLRVCTARDLIEVCAQLEGRAPLVAPADADGVILPTSAAHSTEDRGSLADICGQQLGKRALEVAAAGGHSLLLVGPPGCGKSMLAQRLPTLLPPLTADESIEVAMIGSVTGMPWAARRRPFRAPHHTASASAIIGGGPQARPGEITLAHCGVLFLDELPEFDRRVLESLREPLETGRVSIVRAGAQAEYPAGFQLIAAMNPCPCGWHGARGARCRCKPQHIERYRARLSGPLLDRVDLRVTLDAVSNADLAEHRRRSVPCRAEEPLLHERVRRARERQWARQGRINAALTAADEHHLGIGRPAQGLLWQLRAKHELGMRSLHRLMRVARSLADLEDCDTVGEAHVFDALSLRRALPE